MSQQIKVSNSNYFISVTEAQEQITQLLKPVQEFESIDLEDSLKRILAEDLIATFATPPYDNSAMDGYAFNTLSYQNESIISLKLIGSSFAGHPYVGEVNSGECIRIMTGAKVPNGCNCVVMQEKTETIDEHNIRILQQASCGENIRYIGEDLSQNDIFLSAGKKISAIDLAYIASQGIAKVKVKRKLKVAFFSTGDELSSLGKSLKEGQIYDTNRYSIYGMLSNLNVDVIDMGIIKDDREAIKTAFKTAAKNADIIITSGGVSVGDADYVKEILDSEGDIGFWKISMKPGKPLACGYIHDTLFFGLPGNPVSVIATFYQIVQPALLQLMGNQNTQTLCVPATTQDFIKKRPGRTDFQRGILSQGKNGDIMVKLAGTQASHILTSMSHANCFIVLDKEQGNVEVGERVSIQPFNSLIDPC